MVLKRGSKGDAVKKLQQKLITLGYDIVFLNGVKKTLTADGDFGPITEESLSSYQAKMIDSAELKAMPSDIAEKFVVDGMYGPATQYVMEHSTVKYEEPEEPEEPADPGTPKSEYVNEMIKIARGEVGVVEHGGNNYGDRVEEYQSVGSNGEISGGAPWCQYFLVWCMEQVSKNRNIDNPLPYNGYTPSMVNFGKEKKVTKIKPSMQDIQIGDFGFIYSAARNNAKHIFLIIGKSGDTVTTIEGNTNPGGGADGYGVFKRTRPRTQVWATVRWVDLIK